jgi:hypothetical protein
VTPSFLHVASTDLKRASVTSPLDLPLVGVSTFLEGVLASPDSGQVDGSLGNDDALFSLQALGPTLQRLDVHLHTRSGGFSFFIPVHPMRLHRRHVFASHRRDFVSAASPTRRSGACETWVPLGPHLPGSQSSPTVEHDLSEDPPTCPWTLPDLTCGPKDMKTAWCTRQDSPARISFPCGNRVG